MSTSFTFTYAINTSNNETIEKKIVFIRDLVYSIIERERWWLFYSNRDTHTKKKKNQPNDKDIAFDFPDD